MSTEPLPDAGSDLLSNRFLVAFARTEEALKRLLGTDSRDSFRWLVRQAAKRHPVVRSVEEDLLEYSDLRNAIVHDRGGGFVIAEPHSWVVARLERIVDLIEDPPRVESVMSRPVTTCGPDDPIGEAAKRMMKGGFSRLPVYAERELLGLLTSNAIARWLAARLAGPLDTLQEEPVRTVLGFGEAGRRFELVAADRRVADVVEMFSAATTGGRRLEAVLVTKTGAAGERPLGILTVQDLPRLYALVRP